MDPEGEGQKREARSPEDFPQTGGGIRQFPIFVNAIEAKDAGEYQQERTRYFEPKLMKGSDNTAEG
jgi:hypothetical protein